MKVSDAVKDQVLFFIYKECSMDGRMSAIMENLNQKGIQFNDEQLEKFTKLIMEANNNTRMLEFRGYTPNEISGAVWPFATGKPHTAMPEQLCADSNADAAGICKKKSIPTIRVRAEAVRNIRSAAEEDSSAGNLQWFRS